MDPLRKSDRELVGLTLSGQKDAFGVLYDRYFDNVIRLLKNRVRRVGVAKDLTQESFLQAYLCLKHLRKPESFKSWLHGIALNVHRDYLREKDVSHASFEVITGGCSADAFLLSTHILDPQEIAEGTELRQIVLKAVNSLSPNLRQPVFYYYYGKMSLEEIALRMGLSGSAVKSRFHRGRIYSTVA